MSHDVHDDTFIGIDAHGDCVMIQSHRDKSITVSTQKINSERPGKIVSLNRIDTIALRDWLSKEFPDA